MWKANHCTLKVVVSTGTNKLPSPPLSFFRLSQSLFHCCKKYKMIKTESQKERCLRNFVFSRFIIVFISHNARVNKMAGGFHKHKLRTVSINHKRLRDKIQPLFRRQTGDGGYLSCVSFLHIKYERIKSERLFFPTCWQVTTLGRRRRIYYFRDL